MSRDAFDILLVLGAVGLAIAGYVKHAGSAGSSTASSVVNQSIRQGCNGNFNIHFFSCNAALFNGSAAMEFYVALTAIAVIAVLLWRVAKREPRG
jgi:hypothetical protein